MELTAVPVSDDEILDRIGAKKMPRSKVSSQTYAAIVQALKDEQFGPGADALAQCGDVQVDTKGMKITNRIDGGLQLTSTAVQTASKVSGTAATKLAFLGGPIGIGIGIAAQIGLGIFGAIYRHHAAAVAKEKQIGCLAVPAAITTLNVIDDAVRTGIRCPDWATIELDSLYKDFLNTVRPILKKDSKKCNAACVWLYQLEGIIIKRKDRYANMPKAGPIAGNNVWIGVGTAAAIGAALLI
jgi:hypothetical protein